MSNRFYGAFDFEHLPGKRPDNDQRSPFQIDRDRIVFSTAFRQLQSKTQVFQSGEYDFYRTRLTHTIEVARIARSITEFLNATSERLKADFYIDPDLVEAVGLAHDLGHPPFGHIGERKLNELMRNHGGFEGNAQTLRIITTLIYPRPAAPSGMKPTRAFLDGVLKYKILHSEAKELEGKWPKNHFIYDEQSDVREFVFPDDPVDDQFWNSRKSIECQIMDWADDTAYSLHDIVDGVKARFITPDSLTEWGRKQSDLTDYQQMVLDELIREVRDEGYEPRTSIRIGQFIKACKLTINDEAPRDCTNRHRLQLQVDKHVHEVCQLHKRIAIDLIFKSPPLQQIEFKGGHLLTQLFEALEENLIIKKQSALKILPFPYLSWIESADSEKEKYRLLCDYLSSLTDSQAIRLYKRLYSPDFGELSDLF